MSNLIKLLVCLVVVVLGVIFRKRIKVYSGKGYTAAKGYLKRQKEKYAQYKAKRAAEKKVSYI